MLLELGFYRSLNELRNLQGIRQAQKRKGQNEPTDGAAASPARRLERVLKRARWKTLHSYPVKMLPVRGGLRNFFGVANASWIDNFLLQQGLREKKVSCGTSCVTSCLTARGSSLFRAKAQARRPTLPAM